MRYAENNHIAHLNTGGVLSATEYESIKAATGSRSVTAAYSANAVLRHRLQPMTAIRRTTAISHATINRYMMANNSFMTTPKYENRDRNV